MYGKRLAIDERLCSFFSLSLSFAQFVRFISFLLPLSLSSLFFVLSLSLFLAIVRIFFFFFSTHFLCVRYCIFENQKVMLAVRHVYKKKPRKTDVCVRVYV